MIEPLRGEIWLVDLSLTRGHEQAGKRPGLVISVNEFNLGPAGLIVVIPVTTKKKDISFHVEIHPAESGLDYVTYIKCEDVRSIPKERLLKRLGKVSFEKVDKIEDRLRILLGL